MSDFDEGPNEGFDQRLGVLRSVSGPPPTVAELQARGAQRRQRQRRLVTAAGSGLAVLVIVAIALSVVFLRDHSGVRHDVGGQGTDTSGLSSATPTAVAPPSTTTSGASAPTTGAPTSGPATSGPATSGPATSGPATTGLPTTAPAPSTQPGTTTPPSGAVGPPDGPVPSGFAPVSVTFDSADHGWVLGDAPCATPPCTSLLRTRDGGRTWHGIPAPVASVQTDGLVGGPGARQVARIRFADDVNGWAFGPNLYATHDGGATWAPIALSGVSGDQVIALEASNGTAWALVAQCRDSANRCGSVALYRSAVGVDQWQPAGELDATLGPDRTEGSSALLVVHGANRWVVAGGTVHGGPSDQRLQALATPCGTGPDAPLPAAIAAADDTHLDLMCASSFAAAGHTSKQLMGSTDGGRHWSNSGPPVFSLSGQDGLADNGEGVLLSAEASVVSQIQRTTDDGGRFSTALKDTAGQGRPWADVGFTTPEQAVVVNVGRVLYLSRDAGATWSPVSFGS